MTVVCDCAHAQKHAPRRSKATLWIL